MTTNNTKTRYRDSYARVLVDMHIPDWDERLLAAYEPSAVVSAVAATGATALMVYFQSHVGLCYWPTTSGRQHRAFCGSDPMIETLAAAERLNLPVCAYYSVNFNNWAYLENPSWRMVPSAPGMIGGGLLQRERYGLCCFNNPEYRQFVHRQASEILQGYAIDAIFYDMVWWMSVCECTHCHARYRAQTGFEVPRRIDWLDADWCCYQAAREAWLTEFAVELRERAKRLRPEIDVYHNFALGMTNWTRGVSFESSSGHDFLGGDFYGGRAEQLVISRLMLNLSQTRPVEFMTSASANLAEHEQLKEVEELQTQCQAATASGSAFLMIAALDPDGGLNPGLLGNMRAAFKEAQPYARFLGGEPVEDIGVYFSSESKMSFAESGLDLSELPNNPMDYPHFAAVRGACRILQRAHLPFGVITRKQLTQLDRYRVVLLPNLLRMDSQEIEVFRRYVADGGQLYSSGATSLTSTAGVRADDFLLADVFGCHFECFEEGLTIHLKPCASAVLDAIHPQRYLSHRLEKSSLVTRLRAVAEGTALATLVLPASYPNTGSVDGQDWVSIHSSPPWHSTAQPTVVENSYGSGRSIYCVADLEAGNSAAHERLLLSLIRRLVGAGSGIEKEAGIGKGKELSFSADCHPSVWMTMFDQPQQGRYIISFLNYPAEFPAQSVEAFSFRVAPPGGRVIQRLIALPSETSHPVTLNESGGLEARAAGFRHFQMFAATYAS